MPKNVPSTAPASVPPEYCPLQLVTVAAPDVVVIAAGEVAVVGVAVIAPVEVTVTVI